MKQYLRLAITLLFVLVLGINIIKAQGTSQVRFIHAVPGATAVDVYINGGLAITNLSFGQATGYLTVPVGEHVAVVTPVGIQTPLWTQSISAGNGTALTLIASNPSNLQFDVVPDNLGATNFGATRLLLVHAIANGPDVDVVLAAPVLLNGVLQDAGTAIANGMAYGTAFGAYDLPAQTYTVNVRPTGGTTNLLESVPLSLNAGTSHIAIVYGSANAPRALVAAAPTSAADDNVGFVRFAHGIGGGPAVDVYVNDVLVAPALTPARPTDHISLPAGEHDVLLRVAGTEDEVMSGVLSISQLEAQTLIALANGEDLFLASFADDLSALDEGTALASVINTIPDAETTVTLSDGTSLASNITFGDSGGAIAFEPLVATPELRLTLSGNTGQLAGPETTFYGGVYYNVIVLAGDIFNPPQLIVAPTTLAQTLASAPGDTTIMVAVPPVAEVPEVVQVPDTSSEVVATPPPSTAPRVADVVTARVLLDPGANLQLRQYPSPEALSLGLAPSGSVLEVIGREGAPVALVEGQEPPPEAEDFVDPATLLEEGQDLAADQTWLRVRFTTPDGGTIVAWVNALYLDVRKPDGTRQRLADLEVFGGNVPGESRDTDVTPPPIRTDIVTAEVFNLDPGVSLNIRRTPETTGEVLERIPNGTVVEVSGVIEPVGLPEDTTQPTPQNLGARDWVFITYAPPSGGSISGWVSRLYVRLELNGRTADLDDLEERGFLEPVPADRRGAVGSGASQVGLPTPDPLRDAFVGEVRLDPGANLQFRRNPDSQSESLNLIPSGTRIVVNSRTALSDWLEVTYEGERGWVAAQYVVLTFNSAFVSIDQVPVNTSADLDATESGDDTGGDS